MKPLEIDILAEKRQQPVQQVIAGVLDSGIAEKTGLLILDGVPDEIEPPDVLQHSRIFGLCRASLSNSTEGVEVWHYDQRQGLLVLKGVRDFGTWVSHVDCVAQAMHALRPSAMTETTLRKHLHANHNIETVLFRDDFTPDELLRHEPPVKEALRSFRRDMLEYLEQARMVVQSPPYIKERWVVLGPAPFLHRGGETEEPLKRWELYRGKEV